MNRSGLRLHPEGCKKPDRTGLSNTIHHPAIHSRAKSIISISDGNSDLGESLTEPDTELDYMPENQLGLPENRVWVDHPDVSNVSEASGKRWFDCRQIEAEDST
jgi:hypothetical protein